ncbi:4'-phosphopantetheinyl transferase superfamily protein [Pedobacter frigidisoli]|uniref:4'-phosphopantetheinyl transferase family protein n=1 Tax=Pedobacter frigidisoli TaxID=2530455 RepID=UPI002931D941|nr:4'-phosphopantetheinyl transferase superfamily protein [Pedobacter frigidisoli]
MLGNDVVDLNLAAKQNNFRRANYLNKIFSPEEQQLVYDSDCADLMVWLIWSMKEAAYKIVNRNTRHRFYNPTSFRCAVQLDDLQATGSVDYGGDKFMTHSVITSDYVHTLSVEADLSIDQCCVLQRHNSDDYALCFNRGNEGMQLQKDNSGLPEIFIGDIKTRHLASISHHGQFLFIAFLKAAY